MNNQAGSRKTALQMVNEARSRMRHLSPDETEKEVASGALLVDIRESEERAEHGSIPGSVHAPRGVLEFWADPESKYHRPEFDLQRRIVLHCMAGPRSALATDMLQQMGFSNVAHLDGGLARWVAEGKPVEGGHATAPQSRPGVGAAADAK